MGELWRRGSVVGSGYLTLPLLYCRDEAQIRWGYQTLVRSLDCSQCCGSRCSALLLLLSSQDLSPEDLEMNKVLNGMRAMFGGHDVR